MRIERGSNLTQKREQALEQLMAVMEESITERRICGVHCQRPCPTHNSTTCGCGCGRTCPDIAAMLSSEGEKYPLEPAVAPLVLEMKRLQVFRPNWSCEGHNNPQGQLWKLPKVWFYCDSVLCVRILSETVHHMRVKGGLSATWGVLLAHSDIDNPETTFSLEPLLDPDAHGQPTLGQLQNDLRLLADGLFDQVLLRGCQLYSGIT